MTLDIFLFKFNTDGLHNATLTDTKDLCIRFAVKKIQSYYLLCKIEMCFKM